MGWVRGALAAFPWGSVNPHRVNSGMGREAGCRHCGVATRHVATANEVDGGGRQ